MSEDFGFSPPPFDAAVALITLRRNLRDLRDLRERVSGEITHFEWKSMSVLQLQLADGAIRARLARRPSRSPEWDESDLRAATDVRKLQDEVKRRLLRWSDE